MQAVKRLIPAKAEIMERQLLAGSICHHSPGTAQNSGGQRNDELSNLSKQLNEARAF